ncbi:MAG: HIT family protein [Pseudomonadales bacterium]|nr:HIT family protein [Pseudomonadales bacterium]
MASIFTKIINGDIPGTFIHQDELCVAIMTIQPLREGHVLVIPKQEINHWYDMDDDLTSHIMLLSKKISQAIKIAFPCERVGLMIAGLEVPHAHVHLFPIDNMEDFDMSALVFAEPEALQAAADKITEVLSVL